MLKKNNKGFMLMETLLVSVFLASTLIFLYIQFQKVRDSYQSSFTYDTVINTYASSNFLKYIQENGIKNLSQTIDSGTVYIDLTDCPSGYLTNTPLCQKLIKDLGIKKVIYSSSDTTNLITRMNNSSDFSPKFREFIKNIKVTNRISYRLSIEYNDETYSTVLARSNTVQPVDGPKSFATDSWDVIANAVKTGNTSVYKVGDTKEVTLTGEVAGTYTVRIANNSTPSGCNGADFSETACGFVVEFVDIITNNVINASGTNVGGWPASEMRTYVNNTIYNALPADLKSVITDTKVVSSHGYDNTENFTSTDKLYLLATKEVWGKERNSNFINDDTSDNQTRQLDYYESIGVTTSNAGGAIKQYNGSNYYWWLRSATSKYSYDFFCVTSSGYWNYNTAYRTIGVAPAFRIG